MARISHYKIFNLPSAFYVSNPRNTIIGPNNDCLLRVARIRFNLDQYTSGILALSINSGAYIAEIFKAGIKSIKKDKLKLRFL